MSRNHRVKFPGAIYHVFQRGNNREHKFKNDIEKGFFLNEPVTLSYWERKKSIESRLTFN